MLGDNNMRLEDICHYGAQYKGVSGVGLHRAGRQFTWRWKSKCLANKCLLGYL